MAELRSVEKKYQKIVSLLKERGATVSVMESCTGGLIASLLTDVSGASEVFPGGFVTYSNAAKVAEYVDDRVIGTYGVYSAQTAEAMAKAAADGMNTRYGIGITGSLGRKDPANADSVPGVVYLSVYGIPENSGKLTGKEADGRFRTEKLELTPRKDTPASRRQAKLIAAEAAADLLLEALSA